MLPVDIHIASNGRSVGLYVNVTEGKGTTPGGYRDSWADIAVKNMWLYVAPIILVIGLIGNTLVFLVVRRRSLRGKDYTCFNGHFSIFNQSLGCNGCDFDCFIRFSMHSDWSNV